MNPNEELPRAFWINPDGPCACDEHLDHGNNISLNDDQQKALNPPNPLNPPPPARLSVNDVVSNNNNDNFDIAMADIDKSGGGSVNNTSSSVENKSEPVSTHNSLRLSPLKLPNKQEEFSFADIDKPGGGSVNNTGSSVANKSELVSTHNSLYFAPLDFSGLRDIDEDMASLQDGLINTDNIDDEEYLPTSTESDPDETMPVESQRQSMRLAIKRSRKEQ